MAKTIKEQQEALRKLISVPEIEGVERDEDLENTVGNMLIAQYQTTRLRNRIRERVSGYGTGGINNIKSSTHFFKNDGKWYKITVVCEEVDHSLVSQVEGVGA